MKIINKIGAVGLVLALVLTLVSTGATPVSAATAPNLGAASSYSIWGKSGVTNTGATTNVWGNVGADLLSNITGLIASQVGGTISGPVPGLQTAITAAYGQLNAQGADGGQTLSGTVTIPPGVWTVGAATLNGTVTLSGAGVYILRSSSNITVDPGAQVLLTNGATACNVFWQVADSMTIGVGAHIEGTIIADTSLISLATNASLVGRALSSVSQVTLDNNQITEPVCALAGGGSPRPPVSFTPVFPLISVTKVPNPLALPNGAGSVTYTYTTINIGTVPMSGVSVTDNKCSPVDFISGDSDNDSLLDIDEAWVYRCTKTVTATEVNTATAHGAANNGDVWDTANASVTVGTVPGLPETGILPPLIHLVKTPNVFTLPQGGGSVTYNYTVTNPGVVPLSDVSVTDNRCTGLPGRVVGHPGDLNQNNLLESNEAWSFTCQSYVTETTSNIGTAQGSANGLTAIDFAPATVAVALPAAQTVPGLPNTALDLVGENIYGFLAGIFVLSVVLFFVAERKKII